VAARGNFNFADPYATPADVWNYIAPTSSEYSPSRLWAVDATVGKQLVDLRGGALEIAFGAGYRNESITATSSNPANPSAPYTRYFSINAVGTAGERDVSSAYFELSAPLFEQLELLASGRYDDYSTGQSNFSPKFGFKVTPIDMIAFRGTWSEGFRIPSFNEAFGLPTTGYVSRTVNCTTYAAFCASHGNNAYATAPYNLGLTQTGDPTLDPEESESFTFGIVFEPLRAVSFTIDYWNIEVDGLITGVTSTAAVEAAYYANNGVVNIPGYNVIPGTPDPAFPNALPVLGFVETAYANQDRQEVSGVDFGVNFSIPIGDTVRLNSYLDISHLNSYELITDLGDVLQYAGTLSPCNVTSCSGAPEDRASWQNTLQFGNTSVSLTAYYTSGYDTASIDFGGIEGDCLGNAANVVSTQAYVDGTPVNCTQDEAWNADLTIRHQFGDRYTVYGDFLNVFDIEPDFDPSAAYHLYGYNPAWQGPNMVGRYFRVGFKAEL
jgi:iron complex outermembrane receptor protein